MPARIAVLGMFRSGTSLTTKLVQSWGAYAGSEGELFGDRFGYLEHLGLQKLNDELMADNDRVPPSSELLIEKAQDPNYRQPALQLLEQMDQQTEEHGAIAWVWKDPRLPMLLPFWGNIFADFTYVIPIRHPVETIMSGANMEGVATDELPLSAGFVYWQYNMLNILAFTQDSQHKIFMAFDQMIDHPLEECTRLCAFLDEHSGRGLAEVNRRIQGLAAQVDVNARHYHEARSLAEIEQTTREQRALYDFLRVKTLYPDEAFNKVDFAPYPGWREYLQAMDMLLAASRTQEK
jgi:hypothetical protein